jgi:hypothetical protein
MKKDRLSTMLANVHRSLKPVRGIMTTVGGIITVVGIIGVIIGTAIIQVYLSKFSIYISPIDTLSTRSLEIFMFVFSTSLIGFVGIFLLPFFTPYFVLHETRDILPDLFGMPVRGTIFSFLKEYLPYYFPFLMLNLIVMPVDAYFEIPIPKIISYSMISSFTISALALYIARLKGRRLKRPTYLYLFIDFLWYNYTTIVSMLLLQLIILGVWQHGVAEVIGSKEKATLEIIAVGLVSILCHAFMAWLRPRLSTRAVAGFAVIALYALWLYPGPLAVVAGALREAQLGGGTRISYTVISARATTPEPATGCLVLATTGYVVISEPDDNSCSLPRRFAFTASDVKGWRAQVFSRSEVNISEVPGG